MAADVTHLLGDEEEATGDLLAPLLAELDQADEEHTDVSITDESGWTLSAFADGTLVWEDIEEDDEPQHMTGISRAAMLEHFRAVLDGDLDSVHRLAWAPGYG